MFCIHNEKHPSVAVPEAGNGGYKKAKGGISLSPSVQKPLIWMQTEMNKKTRRTRIQD